MDRIERHDLINAVALAAVLLTLALLLILGARALFRTVDEGLIVSTPREPAPDTAGGEPPAEGEAPPPEPAEGEAAPPPSAEPAADEQPTTTTTVAPRPPGEVTVRVANGAQRPGIAAAGGTRLESLGYDVVDLANAPPRPTSVVFFAQGYEAEARAVADALAVPTDAVGPVPADPGIDASGVGVVVVLGADTSVA